MRLPSLARGRSSFPTVLQMEAADCGVACLASVLQSQGKSVTLEALRRELTFDHNGLTLGGIYKALQTYGIPSSPRKFSDKSKVTSLPPGTILHVSSNHYVVLIRVRNRRVLVMDPRCGKLSLSVADVARTWTGRALLCTEPQVARSGGAIRRGLGPALTLFFRYTSASMFLRVLCASLAAQVVALGLPLIISIVLLDHAHIGDMDVIVIALFLTGINGASVYARARQAVGLKSHIASCLPQDIVHKLSTVEYEDLGRRSTSDLLARLQAAEVLRTALAEGALPAVIDLFLGLVMLVGLSVLDPIGGLSVVPVFLGYALSAYKCSRALTAKSYVIEASRLTSDDLAQQIVLGLRSLRLNGCFPGLRAKWLKTFHLVRSEEDQSFSVMKWYEVSTATVRLLTPLVLLVAWTATRGTAQWRVPASSLLIAIFLAQNLLTLMAPVMRSVAELSNLTPLAARVVNFLDMEEAPASLPTPRSAFSEIKLDEVNFSYIAERPVLRNVSLSIGYGEIIVLMGVSGAGKSTLGALLASLCRPTSGHILVDGASVEHLRARVRLGVVDQECAMYNMTIRENILLGSTDESEEVEAAAKAACIHDEIASMARGYDTLVVNSGANLSGGQRQRIAIARAVAMAPQLLVLDEATSALDFHNESRIQRNLAALGMSQLWITHRHSLAAVADAVYELEQGRLVRKSTTRIEGISPVDVGAFLETGVDQ